MAIYRLPPAPFVGGRQPLDSRDLSAAETGVPVHEPPYQGSARAAQILSIILLAWIPPPAQPQVAWKINPALEAVQEDRPPANGRPWLATVLRAWESEVETRIVSRHAPIEEVLVSAPVLRLLEQVSLRWWVDDSAWRFERRINPALLAVQEDSPPFEQRSFVQRALIRQAWELGPPAPWFGWRVNPAILAVPEDDPPFGQRLWFSGVLRTWEPKLPAQIVLRYAPIEVVAEAPVISSRSWLFSVIGQWQLELPKPQVSWKLSASVLAVREDDPPFGTRFSAQRAIIRDAWELWPPAPWSGGLAIFGFSLGRVSEFTAQRDNQPSLTASYDVAFEAVRSNQPNLKAGD